MKTKCEVYARVVGFIRPVEGFNDAKFQEFNDRVLFEVDK
jgi:anaerobic ribonucleoside-triphosphate reductase